MSASSPVFEIPNELVLQEIKSAYEREWNRKESFESKTNHTITISGTIATLLFGFTTFLFTSLSHENDFFNVIMITLVGSVSSSIVSILLSILASRIQNYAYAIHNIDLKEYKDSTKYIVTNSFINDYYSALQLNANQNDKKAKWIKYAQWVLFFSIFIVLIPLILFFLPSIV
jgi:hypothetical protein